MINANLGLKIEITYILPIRILSLIVTTSQKFSSPGEATHKIIHYGYFKYFKSKPIHHSGQLSAHKIEQSVGVNGIYLLFRDSCKRAYSSYPANCTSSTVLTAK